MEMAEKNMLDLESKLFRVVQVLLNVTLRVNDDGSGTGLISHKIRGVRKAAQIVLFQNHKNLSSSDHTF
jgi:hypothetical protein